jgi:hypothetical protein
MKESGLTYSQACRVYDAMCGVFSDAIITGNRATIGRVGAITPVWRPAREINMHFKVKKGKKVERGIHRTFFMDGRYEFKFRLYRRFIEQHQLRWFMDAPEPSS